MRPPTLILDRDGTLLRQDGDPYADRALMDGVLEFLAEQVRNNRRNVILTTGKVMSPEDLPSRPGGWDGLHRGITKGLLDSMGPATVYIETAFSPEALDAFPNPYHYTRNRHSINPFTGFRYTKDHNLVRHLLDEEHPTFPCVAIGNPSDIQVTPTCPETPNIIVTSDSNWAEQAPYSTLVNHLFDGESPAAQANLLASNGTGFAAIDVHTHASHKSIVTIDGLSFDFFRHKQGGIYIQATRSIS